jgi:hypothetical protein
MNGQRHLGTAVDEFVGGQLDADTLRRHGTILEYHDRSICAVYQGITAAVQVLRIPGVPNVEELQGLIGSPRVLTPGDAYAAYRRMSPHTPDAVALPLLAYTMGSFDDGSNELTVEATFLLFDTMRAFEGWRPQDLRDTPDIVHNRIARFGRGIWTDRARQIPRLRHLTASRRQVDDIFSRREELLAASVN